jgi:hypothetical protein
MSNGGNDLANLFNRVSALEQEEVDVDQSLSRIIKIYARIGVTVTITARLHQYRICGDTQPLYPATCGSDTFI